MSGSAPHLPDSLGLLTGFASITRRIERDLQRQFGLTLGEYEILDALQRGPLPQAQLCDRTDRSGAAVSRWLKRLVGEGWVARHRPSHDGREFIASITKRGLNQHRLVYSHLSETLHGMTDELSPGFEDLLVRLHQNLSHVLSRGSTSTG